MNGTHVFEGVGVEGHRGPRETRRRNTVVSRRGASAIASFCGGTLK
jgi:hypothetical protein